MALSEAQIIKSLVMLGLPARTDAAEAIGFGVFIGDPDAFRRSDTARRLLTTLNADQETAVTNILTQYAAVEFDTDDLDTPEGLTSKPAKQRRLLAKTLAQTIGYTAGGSGVFRLERA